MKLLAGDDRGNLAFRREPDLPPDRLGRDGVVARHDEGADLRRVALRDRFLNALLRRVDHAGEPEERHVALGLLHRVVAVVRAERAERYGENPERVLRVLLRDGGYRGSVLLGDADRLAVAVDGLADREHAAGGALHGELLVLSELADRAHAFALRIERELL